MTSPREAAGNAWYNEIDPYAAQWLRNLIAAGLIPAGDVDERSVADVRPGDLSGYTQCHFFAGLGGWPRALRLAGWPDDRPVWTGSCPCQPFSAAGKRRGFADERHLWPIWFNLIRERRPPIVFGEQVASATDWLGLVRSDLETVAYAMGTMPIQAASAGAFHLRDRFWFVAHRTSEQPYWCRSVEPRGLSVAADNGEVGHANIARSQVGTAGMADTDQPERRIGNQQPARQQPQSECDAGARAVEWLVGADGKARPVKPGVRLLAHGIPARVAKLRALGNAIDPRVAAAFVEAAVEAMP